MTSSSASLDAFAREDGTIEELRRVCARLARQLEQEKVRKSELVEAVYRAASDAIAGLSIPAVEKPEKDRRRGTAETAVILLSDLQCGKRTPTYNTDVCEQRVEMYADKVLKLTNIQRSDHPVREARLWLLGDLLEGEDIFAGQPHQIDASLYQQVAVDVPRIVSNFVRRMASHFDRLHVVGVPGNHGHIGGRGWKNYNQETNTDRIAYTICEGLLRSEKRVTWHIPSGNGERNWFAIDQIGSYRAMLIHGEQFRGGGFAGFPFYGAGRRIWSWKAGGLGEDFTDVYAGHWHQNVTLTLNKTILRVNGTTESSNDYAREELAAAGRPSQRLLFVHPEHHVTAEYICWLDQV